MIGDRFFASSTTANRLASSSAPEIAVRCTLGGAALRVGWPSPSASPSGRK